MVRGGSFRAVDGTSAGQPRRRGMAVGIPEPRSVRLGQFLGTREALPLRGNDTRTDATFFAGCGKKSGKGGKGVFFAGGHAR